jgi:hypothetical protein
MFKTFTTIFSKMSNKTYLTIDPGANGGWAFYQDGAISHGGIEELVDFFPPVQTTIVIEKVPPFVGRAIPSSASFKLGYSYGWLVGLWQGRGFKVVLVTPQEWQKTIGVGTKGKQTTTEWKNKLKAEAQRRYPTQTITLKNADAFCILSHSLQHNL